MATTKIEWTDKVWNPVTGCTPISEGCKNCYAKKMACRLQGRHGYDAIYPFQITVHSEDKFLEPLRWKKPSTVFVCSMGDLFHKDVYDSEIHKVFAIAAILPKHNFLFLTKRPERMAEYFSTPAKQLAERWEEAIYLMGISDENDDVDSVACYLHNRCALGWPLKNIWLGVTVENQQAADQRLHYLNSIRATVKFVSCEPLLSGINFKQSLGESLKWHAGGLKNCISWVIAGGETGNKARPVHPDWLRSLRDQCKADGIPLFFKGWGEFQNGSDYINHNPKNYVVLKNGEYANCDNNDWKSISKKYTTIKWNELAPFIIGKVGKKQSGDFLDGKQYHELPKHLTV